MNDTHTATVLADLLEVASSPRRPSWTARRCTTSGVGRGPTLVLMHGFPQDWYGWRRIMPRLATRFTVLAVDLPGVGGSAPLVDGYAAADLARHVHHLVDGLGSGNVDLAGRYDIGGCVAYAYARLFPERTRTVAVLEVPIPGIEPQLLGGRRASVARPLPHDARPAGGTVTGRQSTYFRYFFDTFTADATAIGDADVEHYVDAYRRPEQLRSAIEFYRAMQATGPSMPRDRTVDVPLLLVGGGHLFGAILPELAQSLRANYGWADVRVRVVDDAQHYLVEERPDEVAESSSGTPVRDDRRRCPWPVTTTRSSRMRVGPGQRPSVSAEQELLVGVGGDRRRIEAGIRGGASFATQTAREEPTTSTKAARTSSGT